MPMLEFTDGNFKKEVLESEIPVLVDYWAAWCGPCKGMTPIIEEVAEGLKGKVKVGKLNVDENPQVTNSLNILNIPTLIFFKDGKEAARMVGIQPRQVIVKKLEELICR